jgi:hypothetical protein
MGRIIRAYAEIEDIVTLVLCSLIGLNEAKALVLFGRMAISAKLKIMESFSRITGPDAIRTYNLCFDSEDFHSITRCRNAIAHGVYFGVTEGGEYAFRLSAAMGGIEGQMIGFRRRGQI